MQCKEFTFRGVCDFVLYRAMEEGRTAWQALYESNELIQQDQERVRCVLSKIENEGRIKKDILSDYGNYNKSIE